MAREDVAQLNPQQEEAVLHTEGPLLILAGAGSGKTSTMTHRIAHLIRDKGVPAWQILAVTFTNKAAGEMRERVEDLLGGPVDSWIMTFHAACLRILRRYADRLGYNNSFTVYDPVDCKALVKRIQKEEGIDEKANSVASLLGQISDCKEEGLGPEDYLRTYGEDYRSKVFFRVYRAYERELKKNNAMDFDDLLLNAVRLLQQEEEVREHYQRRFRYIMVDEYQDTNHIQYELVRLLAEANGNLCVVGDDDQCIYQWRGADIRNILDFEKDFPGTKIIKLEKNYRSTSTILQAAHDVISHNFQRKEKKLWTDGAEGEKLCYYRADDEKDEARYVAQEVLRLTAGGAAYKDIAVLYRTNAQSRTFEDALSAREIPYRVVGGIRYYERKEIKDMVAYLRLVENPRDELSFLRIINEPRRGIGKGSIDKLTALAGVRSLDLWSCLQDPDSLEILSAKAKTSLQELMETLQHYHEEKANLRISDIYDGLLTGTGYMKALEDMNNAEGDGRLENLLEFRSVIQDYEKEGSMELSEFLERMALISDVDNHDPKENAVVLMTLHSAKGLEFPYVFMPGMEDGLFPGWRALDRPEGVEEERRLCYVGITRAKRRLWMTSAAYRTLYGKGSYTRESTFLREVDPRNMTGDAVFADKQERLHGQAFREDGYEKKEAFRPFDRLSSARRAVKEKKKVEVFHEGEQVFHAKFGEGTVLEVQGNVLSVMFEREGLKKLAADIAPLQKIEE